MGILEHAVTPGHLVALVCVALVFDAPISLQSRLQVFPIVRRRTSRIFKCSFGSSPSQSNAKKLGGVIDKERICSLCEHKLPGSSRCLIRLAGINIYKKMVAQAIFYGRKVSSKAQNIKMNRIKAVSGRSHLKWTIL